MAERRRLNISDLIELVSPTEKDGQARALVERAYTLADMAHDGQMRKSGGPYIEHPLCVAYLLATLGMDADAIAAGLLHDVVEDTDIDLVALEAAFGTQVSNLVDGVTKLERIEEQIEQELRGEQELESMRKMFLAMSEDIRVVIIKLADRLHNMRTLYALRPERQKTYAHETLEIYAPLANRLGIWQWKWELEDLSLFYIDPQTYDDIASLTTKQHEERQNQIMLHVETLRQRIEEEGIQGEITGRPKHIYSIYRKMQRKGVPFQQVYDVRAVRVITDTVSNCYRILGIVHGLWTPIPGEFDDYIATPKDNDYQSLHTAVICGDGTTMEVQIRTWQMHHTAEFGIAAHWRYKEGGKPNQAFENKIALVRSVVEWRTDATDAAEFVDAMKTDAFQDRVYTFTPKGKLIDLPVGATPIDFAYQIHTEIGHHCRGARVNSRMVSLDTRLKTGDRVEILTTRRGGPSRDWLNPHLGYIKTSRARTKIRQWFRRQDRAQNVAEGREVVERELKRLGIDHLSHEAVAVLFGHDKLDDFLARVGFGDINSQQIASKIAETRPSEIEQPSPPLAPPPPVTTIEGIQVQGTGGLLTRLARCCSPLIGDEIVGYVTRGRGITIHRRDCANILALEDVERLIEVNWGTRRQTMPVTIRITAFDRAGLLSEISNIIGAEGINIAGVNHKLDHNITRLFITLEVNDIAQLSRVLAKIERLPNVTEARRHTG
jgi:RelA/SpoT family (p)ppGpp synthetase